MIETQYPPQDPPTVSESNPRAAIDELFGKERWPTYFTDQQLDEIHTKLMSGSIGIHMRLVGSFWDVSKAKSILQCFEEFVHAHKIPVKVTWEPRQPGGWWGVAFYGAELDECQKHDYK